MLKLENLKKKNENGMTLYFYAGFRIGKIDCRVVSTTAGLT